MAATGAASSQRPLCACSGGLSPKAVCVQAYLSTRQVTAALTHCPAGRSLRLSSLSRAGVRQGCHRPRSSWAELLGPPSGCALPTAAPERRQFEKATGTRPRVSRLGRPRPVNGAAVCVCGPSPPFPCVLIGCCQLAQSRCPGMGEEGAASLLASHFPSPPLRCPAMLGDHTGLSSDRALLGQAPKTGLSCKMVLQAVGKVLR